VKENLVNTCRAIHPDYEQQQQRLHLQHNKQDEFDVKDEEQSPLPVWECPITIDVLAACNKTSGELQKVFSKKLKYKHQLDGTDEVAFLMVHNNHSVIQGKLDGVRQKRHRFICLNDNINHSNPDAAQVVKVLHDFYTALLPLPSPFELPPGVHNNFAYIADLRAARADAARRRQWTIIVGSPSLFILFCTIFKCYSHISKADRRSREISLA